MKISFELHHKNDEDVAHHTTNNLPEMIAYCRVTLNIPKDWAIHEVDENGTLFYLCNVEYLINCVKDNDNVAPFSLMDI